MQTTFLVSTLENMMSRTCRHTTLDQLTLKDTENGQLLLIDCNVVPPSRAQKLLSPLIERTHTIRIAFFNASPDTAIEPLARWPHVKGIFSPEVTQKDFILGLTEILKGNLFFPPGITQRLIDGYRNSLGLYESTASLTRRELEVLGQLKSGASNSEIARVLNLSEHTVKSHLYNIFKKIKVNNRLQALAWAEQHTL